MAKRFQNIAGFFQDSRVRMITLLMAFFVFLFVVIIFFSIRPQEAGPGAEATIAGHAPSSIDATPGGFGKPESVEYVKLQSKQNLEQAREALQHGTSAIPTITRTQMLNNQDGNPQDINAAVDKTFDNLSSAKNGDWNAGLGYGALARMNQLGVDPSGEKSLNDKSSGTAGANGLAANGANGINSQGASGASGSAVNGLNGAGVNGVGSAGAGANGLGANGLNGQGGMGANGSGINGVGVNGVGANGLNGIGAGGAGASGLGANGLNTNGLGANGAGLNTAGANGLNGSTLAGTTGTPSSGQGVNGINGPGIGGLAGQNNALGTGNGADRSGDFGDQSSQIARAPGGLLPQSQLPGAFGGGQESENLAKIAQRQQQFMTEQQRQQALAQKQSSIATQANQLMVAWVSPSQAYVAGVSENDTDADASRTGRAGVANANSARAVAGRAGQGKTLIKAGTIMFAVLRTAVNSDEIGPVLAEIVDGPYKGCRLIGRLIPQDQHVMLNFDQLVLPGKENNLDITAVAIDPNTARTAISSYTNNHYMLRYGSLFAASFMQGYGQAFLASGQTVTTSSTGQTSSSPDLSSKGKLAVAFGNVGNQWGSHVNQNFNRPATVYVYSGTGVGVLFMKNVTAAAAQ